MIFLNVPEAREQLVKKGIVYTLRSPTREEGLTRAVRGTYNKNVPVCPVFITRLIPIQSPDELHPYVESSGFKSVEAWMSKAAPWSRTLYKVEIR